MKRVLTLKKIKICKNKETCVCDFFNTWWSTVPHKEFIKLRSNGNKLNEITQLHKNFPDWLLKYKCVKRKYLFINLLLVLYSSILFLTNQFFYRQSDCFFMRCPLWNLFWFCFNSLRFSSRQFAIICLVSRWLSA